MFRSTVNVVVVDAQEEVEKGPKKQDSQVPEVKNVPKVLLWHLSLRKIWTVKERDEVKGKERCGGKSGEHAQVAQEAFKGLR